MKAQRQPRYCASTPVISAESATPRLPQTPLMPTSLPSLLGIGDDHRRADRVIDRGEDADREQRDAELQRRLHEADADHARPMPMKKIAIMWRRLQTVAEPAGGERAGAEGDEARRRVGQQFARSRA